MRTKAILIDEKLKIQQTMGKQRRSKLGSRYNPNLNIHIITVFARAAVLGGGDAA
jgi:hypothetical protein